jgi:hypothetical protein
MNERRVCLIGIENKVVTMNYVYNVFLQYEINSIQYPVLLTFLLFPRLAPYLKKLTLSDRFDYIVIRAVLENKTSINIKN